MSSFHGTPEDSTNEGTWRRSVSPHRGGWDLRFTQSKTPSGSPGKLKKKGFLSDSGFGWDICQAVRYWDASPIFKSSDGAGSVLKKEKGIRRIPTSCGRRDTLFPVICAADSWPLSSNEDGSGNCLRATKSQTFFLLADDTIQIIPRFCPEQSLTNRRAFQQFGNTSEGF